MTDNQKIFVAYCYPDKKWLDRLQVALEPVVKSRCVVTWDDRKLRFNNRWRSELSQVISDCSLALVLVSDRFLDSDFVVRARLANFLKSLRAGGLDARWIVVSHCLYRAAGFEESLALNPLDWPLEGLSTAHREAALADIAQKVRVLLSGSSDEELPSSKWEDTLPSSPYMGRLAQAARDRRRTVSLFRNLTRALLPLAVAIVAAAFVIAFPVRDLELLLLIAGFGVFVAALALVLKTRGDFIEQSIVRLRCIRTGLADETLPERQRTELMQNAKETLGER